MIEHRDNVHCTVCGFRGEAFLDYGLPPRKGLCPKCGAKPRHRTLGPFLAERAAPRLGHGTRVLEIGPGKLATGHFVGSPTLGDARYTAIDVRKLHHHHRLRSPHAFVRMSTVQLGFPARSFDLVLCCNVLAHVDDYRGALAEIARCLKHDAMVIFILHRGVSRTVSAHDYHRAHPELDEAWFAANGDQWNFGEDFFEQLEQAGIAWQLDHPNRELSAETVRREGLKPHQELILGFVSEAGRERYGFGPPSIPATTGPA